MSDTNTALQHSGDGTPSRQLPSITTASRTPVRLHSLDDVFRLGKVLAQSGFFSDAKQAGQAVTKVLAGAELGLSPIASMTGIHVIKSKITMSANVIASQIKRSGRYDYRVKRMDENACTIAFFERGEEIGESTFTEDDAKKAGTQNMKSFPRNMLFARALTNGARWYCPDVFNGPVYTAEEMGAPVNGQTGEVEEAYWEEVDSQMVDYDQRIAQLTGWLKAKRPGDYETSRDEALSKLADWPEEAARSARDAIEDVTAIRTGLIEELEADLREALPETSAVNAVADDWKERLEDLPKGWQHYANERYTTILEADDAARTAAGAQQEEAEQTERAKQDAQLEASASGQGAISKEGKPAPEPDEEADDE